jgi:F-type H+-transporting ATPase subunit gamma
METLSEELSRGFLAGEFDQVLVAYTSFKSTFEQVPMQRQLLPLSLPALAQVVEGIVPAKGKWSTEQKLQAPASYEVEPSADEVLGVLIPRLAAIALYHMLLESKASEHSARMVAMKNASDKSKEVAHDLTRLYNKIRQAAITREVSEIVGGREALAV